MSNDTKDRILEAALEIFSRDGYAGANLKDIAGAVGVVKSGFYRHYASKEEVWDAVLDEMERYYAERFGSSENLPAIPQSTDELKTVPGCGYCKRRSGRRGKVRVLPPLRKQGRIVGCGS